MEVTAELRERIYSLSPDKLKQLERFVNFLMEETKQKKNVEDSTQKKDENNSNTES
ncbi:MAG: hypothetical protein H7289_02450 [Mucilaginibacter sp.]|nr:hypothetical protein [Mucilaginibacter sp.]